MEENKNTWKKIENIIVNNMYYVIMIYFFLMFIIVKENTTPYGKMIYRTFYNIHIELFFLMVLLIRITRIADAKTIAKRGVYALLLLSYTIGDYIDGSKIDRIREIILFGLVITAVNIDFNKIIKWVFGSYTIVALYKVAGSILGYGTPNGWIRQLSVEMDYGRGIVENRYQFGFGQPNACHCAFFVWAVLLLILVREKKKAKYGAIVCLGVCNLILYKFTISRAGVMIVFAALILYAVCPLYGRLKNKLIRIILYICAQSVPFLVAAFTLIIGHIGPDKPGMQIINVLVTGRLGFMHNTMEWTPLTFFGRTLPVVCDSNYINMLYRCGIYAFLIYMILHVIMVHYLYKKNMYDVIGIVIAFDIYYMVECTILSMNRNVLFYFIIAAVSALDQYDRAAAKQQACIKRIK